MYKGSESLPVYEGITDGFFHRFFCALQPSGILFFPTCIVCHYPLIYFGSMKQVLASLCLLLAISICAHAQTDTLIGRDVPSAKDYKTLTARVCAAASTEKQKANAIYNWITTHIAYDLAASKNPEREQETTKTVLQKGEATPDGYTLLYVAMCREAGLDAAVVEGYLRSWFMDNNDPFFIPRHAWCVVKIDGEWHIADPTIGAGYMEGYYGWWKRQMNKLSKPKLEYPAKEHFVFKYNPAYFMAEPLAYSKICLPADPAWQLANTTMPLQVFEAGKEEVEKHNKQNPDLNRTQAQMLKKAGYTEDERLIEGADRVYTFNNRFIAIKGIKQALEANNKWAANSRAADATLYRELKASYTSAKNYIKEQKQPLTTHYAAMQKKNDTKNMEGLAYIRQIKTSGKMQQAKAERYINTCKRKADNISQKQEEHNKPLVIKSKPTTRTQPTDARIKNYLSSIETRQAEIEALQQGIDRMRDSITIATQQYNNLTTTIDATMPQLTDILVPEAKARVYLHDNYDDEVKPYMEDYKTLRLVHTDTLLNKLYTAFDDVNEMYEELKRRYAAILRLQKENAKDALNCSPNNDTKYADLQKTCQQAWLTSHVRLGDVYKNQMAFCANNKGFFASLNKFFENEGDIADDMETAEKARHEKEDKSLKEHKAFDDGEAKKQIRILDEQIKKLDALLKN
ncbi:hypothetical protein CAP35_13255 [Chitinophagaceae bacterium IBVUCB1]|nr:hypothetical protein CAP35_13255 [Chitinophagaceae bacterium IBVUCB1]